jgi:hypothetical protein
MKNRRNMRDMIKKIMVLLLTMAGIISISMAASAHHGPGRGYPPPPDRGRWEARSVLDETKAYIFRAQRVAHGYQRAELRRAYSLQAEARNLYRHSFYQRAIRLSYRAREIAQDIIERAERRYPPPPPPPPYHHHDDDGESSIHINLNL